MGHRKNYCYGILRDPVANLRIILADNPVSAVSGALRERRRRSEAVLLEILSASGIGAMTKNIVAVTIL
jgi:hypothetical protein